MLGGGSPYTIDLSVHNATIGAYNWTARYHTGHSLIFPWGRKRWRLMANHANGLAPLTA